MRRHVLRNAMIPVVTFIGIDFGTLVGFAVLTETVFNLPGLGSKIVQAAVGRRPPRRARPVDGRHARLRHRQPGGRRQLRVLDPRIRLGGRSDRRSSSEAGPPTGLERRPAQLTSRRRSTSSLTDVGPTAARSCQDAWRRFRRNKLAMFGLVLVVFLVLVAIFGPFLVQDPLRHRTRSAASRPPSQHWFGTDQLGRDVFARVVTASACRCSSASSRPCIETIIGVRGRRDRRLVRRHGSTPILMRFVDILLGIPYIILAFAFIAVLGRGVDRRDPHPGAHRLAADGPDGARRVPPGQASSSTSRRPARVGVSTRRIMWRHILPNVFQPVIVLMAVGVGSAILAEAAL